MDCVLSKINPYNYFPTLNKTIYVYVQTPCTINTCKIPFYIVFSLQWKIINNETTIYQPFATFQIPALIVILQPLNRTISNLSFLKPTAATIFNAGLVGSWKASCDMLAAPLMLVSQKKHGYFL
jgi:hypothetical protein